MRHFLLEPSVPNYPQAPRWLLNVYFMFAAVLILAGLRFLTVWLSGEAATIPPGATGMGVLLALATFTYKSSMLFNVARQRYPVETWARPNRISEQARCSRRKKGKSGPPDKGRSGGPPLSGAPQLGEMQAQPRGYKSPASA